MATLYFHNSAEYWKNVGGAPLGIRQANFVMADDVNDMNAPLAAMLFMPPNFELPKHDHDCYRVEVVVQRSLAVGDKVHHPGDVSISRPGEPYGPHVAGPTGCLTVEIFSRQEALMPTLHVEHWREKATQEAAAFGDAVAAWRAAHGKAAESVA